MSIVNFVPTKAGKKASAVCEFCGRKSRPVRMSSWGEPDLWSLPQGWSVAPYPAGYVHEDGSTGSLWSCPDCNKTLDRGELRAVHPDRQAAITTRRADRLSVQIRG